MKFTDLTYRILNVKLFRKIYLVRTHFTGEFHSIWSRNITLSHVLRTHTLR